MNAPDSGFGNLKINPDWAKLPLFDRTVWKRLPFGAFAESVNDRVEPADAADEIYVGLEHLDPRDLHIRRWGKGSDVIGTKLRFRKGDVIFGRRRAYQRKLAVAEFDGICSAHAMVVRANPEVVLPEFLPLLMMSDRFMKRAVEISVGSLSPTINWTALKLEEFVVPTLEQQRQIAEMLWAIDTALEKNKTSLNAAQRYKDVILKAEFSAVRCTRIRLADLCGTKAIRIGPFGSQLHAHEYVDEGIPIVMPANLDTDQIRCEGLKRIGPWKVDELAIHKLEEGDVLLPRRGDLKKRGFVYPGQGGWICGTGTIRVRYRDVDKRRLLFYALSGQTITTWLQRHAVGTTMPNLNSTIVGNIEVNWPTDSQRAQELIAGADRGIGAVESHIVIGKNLLMRTANFSSA